MSYTEKTIGENVHENVHENIHVDEDVKQTTERLVIPPVSQTKHGSARLDVNKDLAETSQDSLAAPYDGLAVSLEVYWAEFYGQTEHTYEWNDGILEAKPMAKLIQVKAYLWFLRLLEDYLFGNAIAEMTLLETPFKLNIQGRTKVRIPDLAVVLNSNPVPLGMHDSTYAGIFDICIESVSDSKRSEVERDTIIKRNEYAQAGVTEYFILDEINPADRRCETAFYRLSPGGIYQPIQPINGVIRSTVLPGFQLRVDDLEDRPGLLEMLDDPVYGFTSPVLRSERLRAERELRQEQERADRAERELQAEKERAEQEMRSQAARINAYLKEQGISLPDDLINTDH